MHSHLHKLCQEKQKSLNSPGLILSVRSSAKSIYSYSEGFADVEKNLPITVDSLFPIGSLTKSFAAASILKLRDEGLLSLSDSPLLYVPELKNSKHWESVSLHHLMSMQGGLASDFEGSWAEHHLSWNDVQLSELFSRVVIPVSNPGEQYQYSNFGYMLLGRVISSCSGVNAREFIKQKFLIPLGMQDTTWEVPEGSRVLTGYIDRDGKLEKEITFSSEGDGAVFGGLWSSFENVFRWFEFLGQSPNADEVDREQILKKTSRMELQHPKILTSIYAEDDDYGNKIFGAYGYGVKFYSLKNSWSIGHSGAVPGFGVHVRWVPEKDLYVFAVGNIRYCPLFNLVGEVVNVVLDESQFEEKSKTMPPAVLKVGKELLDLIKTKDLEKYQELFALNFFYDCPRAKFLELILKLNAEYSQSLTSILIEYHGSLSGALVSEKKILFKYYLSPVAPEKVQEVVWDV